MAAVALALPSSSFPGDAGLDTPSTHTSHEDTEWQNPTEVESAKRRSSSDLLTLKMLQVLQEKHYDVAAQNKVYERVQSNIVSTSSSTDNTGDQTGTSTKQDVRKKLEQMITGQKGMLNKELLREKNLYLNSNEPVLMIGLGTEHTQATQDMRSMRDMAVEILRDNGVRPVRVFVRSEEDTEDRDQIVLTLLNVVNTDIGENMIHLLDAAFYGEGWKQDLIAKEAWNGHELLWRDENVLKQVSSANESWSTPESATTSLPRDVSIQDAMGESAIELQHSLPQEAAFESSVSANQPQIDSSVQDVVEEQENKPVEHPAMQELLESESRRPQVQHPTWNRQDHSASLIDLIRRQSSTMPEQEADSEKGAVITDHVDSEGLPVKSQSASEDGYVVL